ncbi:hypothetical protein ACHAXN_011716 [Cyclotella atomus]
MIPKIMRLSQSSGYGVKIEGGASRWAN